jgi:hypothetical protein
LWAAPADVTPTAVNASNPTAFTLEIRAAGPGVQIASAAGAVAMLEARRLERGVLDGPLSRSLSA